MQYTVERCRKTGGYPRCYGYTIRDNTPHVQTHDDIRGVGRRRITPVTHHFVGWYKYKRDASKRAVVLNQ